MHAAVLRIEIRIPGPRSLKGKRAMLRPVMARLRALDVAVSEVDHQNAWQLATIGVALVAPQMSHLEEVIGSVKRAVLGDPTIEVLSIELSHLERP
jgi:uncharacterized protein